MATLKLGGVSTITESGGAVSLDSGVIFPAGHVIQTLVFTNTGNGQSTGTKYAKSDNTWTTTATSTPNWSITKKSSNSNFMFEIGGSAWTGSHNNGQQEGYQCDLRYSLNSDMSSTVTAISYYYMQWDTRGGDNPPSQTSANANGMAWLEAYTNSAIGTVIYFDIQKYAYGSSMNAGYTGNNGGTIIKVTEIQQ